MKTALVALTVLLALVCLKAEAFAQPYSAGDDYAVFEETGHIDVKVNDVPSPNNNIRVTEVPERGRITNLGNGIFFYESLLPPFTGSVSFRYQYCYTAPQGGEECTNEATVFIGITGAIHDLGYFCLSVGGPINVTNGNMWLRQRDYSLPGIGENIEIDRFYNSAKQSSGIFGFGWTTKYDVSLTVYDDRMLRVDLGDAKGVYFGRPNTSSAFRSISPDFTGQITKDGSDYTLVFLDGRSHKFDSTGRLLWQKDANGNQTTLNYTSGVLTGITDPFQRTVTFTYPLANQMKISDAMGLIATYDYVDVAGTTVLEKVTYPDGSKYTFEYDTTTASPKKLLKTVKDALGNILETHLYDSQGRAYTSERQGGVESYTLSYSGSFTTVTDARGNVSKYHFIRQSGKNLVTQVEGLCSCGGGGSETTTYEHDPYNSNLKKTINALGHETTYTYDGDRNLIQATDIWGTQKWTYNSRGQVLSYQDRVDSPGTNNTAVLTYDTNGNLLTATDALSKTTTLVYPKTNNRGLPDSVKDARNNLTKFQWFPVSGLLEHIEDPYGKKTKFIYDDRGRITSRKNALNHETTYEYIDGYIDKEDTQPHSRVEVTYPNSDKVVYRFDKRRLLDKVTDERTKVTRIEFDDSYRLKKITDPLGHVKEFGYDNMSFMNSYTDPTGKVTNFEPDDFGRLEWIEYPAKESGQPRLKERFEYDKVGRIKKYFDTADRLTLYGYDDVNRTNTVTNAELEVTTTKYNQRFQTFEVKDALNQAYTFNYDPLNSLLSQARAGGTMSFVYDEVGNLKKRTDYAGRITDYTHDNLNRLTKIEYTAGTDNPAKQTSTYGYDDISRITSAVNESGTVTFGYDTRGRLTSTTDVFGQALVYEYERTSTVNQKRLKLNGSLYTTYNFDDAERLSNIVNASDSTTISFGYDNEDKITSRTYPNGITTTYEYFDDDQLKRLKDVNSSTTLFDRQYTYNAAKQIASITEPSGTRAFTYDLVDRLRTVTGSQTESYNFDDVGNRTSSHLSSTYGYQTGQFNRLISTTTATYSFDANGNTASKSEGSNLWRYGWDHQNRMVSASTRKQTVRYKYDALGRRVQRDLANGRERTQYTYNGGDVLVDDHNGTLTKYLDGEGIDNKLRSQTGTSVSYFLADHLGSTNGLADSTGAITSQTAYDLFGNQSSSLGTRYGFTGRERDDFNGLMYHRARFYDPKLGRFVSEDPIGFEGGNINLYGYVGNNAANRTDPLGLIDPIVNQDPRIYRLNSDVTPSDIADALDRSLDSAKRSCGCDAPIAYNPLTGVTTLFGIAHGMANWLRVGNGLGQAMSCDENGWGRAAFVLMDVERGAGLFAAMAGPFAGRLGGSAATRSTGVPRFSGTEKPWTNGATPNSIYTQLDANGAAVQNAIYNGEGKVIGHVDFKNHGPGAPSGHGHSFPVPGNPASGHGPLNQHIPYEQLPPGWGDLPPSVRPRTPLGH